MSLRMIVLVKQVPDTHHVSGDAMKPDGTVNRAVLPAIINPEDLNALEMALQLKDTHGGTITAITMGPPKAIEVLKESLYRGADDVILISDRAFAGADTLATSYALSCAINKIGKFDLVFAGRQAIDGDTAQVGPQVAEKLGINQMTFVSDIVDATEKQLTARRIIEGGYEILQSKYPLLITVIADSNEPRARSARKVMAYKNITSHRVGSYNDQYLHPMMEEVQSHIREWNIESIKADPARCGLTGSPTKVKKIENVVLTAREMKQISNTNSGINDLIQELVQDHIIG